MATKEGVLENLAKTEVFGIPVGAAATGALAAGLFDGMVGIVKRAAPQIPSWALSAMGAWAAVQWGDRLMGRTAANVAGLLLAYDALQSFFPIREYISNLFAGIGASSSYAASSPAPIGTPETIEEYLTKRGF